MKIVYAKLSEQDAKWKNIGCDISPLGSAIRGSLALESSYCSGQSDLSDKLSTTQSHQVSCDSGFNMRNYNVSLNMDQNHISLKHKLSIPFLTEKMSSEFKNAFPSSGNTMSQNVGALFSQSAEVEALFEEEDIRRVQENKKLRRRLKAEAEEEENQLKIKNDYDRLLDLGFKRYTSGTSLNELVRIYGYHNACVGAFVALEWPKEYISGYKSKVKRFEDNKTAALARDHSRGVTDNVLDRAHAVGAAVEHWRVPYVTHVRIPKPVKYDHESFRNWIHGEATYFRVNNRSKKDVFGNKIAQALYYNCKASNADVLMANASVYLGYASKDLAFHKDEKFTLFDFIPKSIQDKLGRQLVIMGRHISSIEELMPLESNFRTNKTAFRKAVAYLRGDEGYDRSRIESLLNQILTMQMLNSSKFATVAVPLDEVVEIKVERQALFEIDHNHVHSIIIDALPDDLDLGREALKIVSFACALITSTSWNNFVAVLSAFVSSYPRLYAKLTGFIGQYTIIERQGLGDWFFSMSTEIKVFVTRFMIEAGVFSMLTSISSTLAEALKGVLWELVAQVKKVCFKAAASAVAAQILESMSSIFIKIRDCWETGSFTPLFGRKYCPTIWIEEARQLEHYANKLTASKSTPRGEEELTKLRLSGDVPAWCTKVYAPQEFSELLSAHLRDAAKIEELFNVHSNIMNVFRIAVAKFTAFASVRKVQTYRAGTRVQPFLLFLYGEVGTGKTTMMQKLISNIGRLNGFSTESDGIFSWLTGVNFQDGLNHAHWCITLDDLDHMPFVPSEKSLSNIVVDLVNVNPFPIEQADVSEKGRYDCQAKLVTISSNFPNFCCFETHKMPSAPLRRVSVRARVVVKSQYARDGLLDENKIKNAKDCNFWDIYVTHFKKSGPPESPDLWTPEVKMDYYQFNLYVQATYRKHMANQEARLCAPVLGTSCGTCGEQGFCYCAKDKAQLKEQIDAEAMEDSLYEIRDSAAVNRAGVLSSAVADSVEIIRESGNEVDDDELARIYWEEFDLALRTQGLPVVADVVANPDLIPASIPGFVVNIEEKEDNTGFHTGELIPVKKEGVIPDEERITPIQKEIDEPTILIEEFTPIQEEVRDIPIDIEDFHEPLDFFSAFPLCFQLMLPTLIRRNIKRDLKTNSEISKSLEFTQANNILRDTLPPSAGTSTSVPHDPDSCLCPECVRDNAKKYYANKWKFLILFKTYWCIAFLNAKGPMFYIVDCLFPDWFIPNAFFHDCLVSPLVAAGLAVYLFFFAANPITGFSAWFAFTIVGYISAFERWHKVRQSYGYLKNKCALLVSQVKKPSKTDGIAMKLGLASIAIGLVVMYLKSQKTEHNEEKETVENPGVTTTVEKQSREGNRNPGFETVSWQRIQQQAPINLFVGRQGSDYGSLSKLIRDNLVKIETDASDGLSMKSWGVVVGTDHILATTHSVIGGKCKITMGTIETVLICNKTNMVILPTNTELCVILVPTVRKGPNIFSHLLGSIDFSVCQFDDVMLITKVGEREGTVNSVKGLPNVTAPILCCDVPTEAGDCGNMYVVKFNGAWHCVAMHFAKVTYTSNGKSDTFASGAMISKIEIARAIEQLGDIPRSCVVVENAFGPKDATSISPMSIHSSLLASETFHNTKVHTVGRIEPPLSLGKPRTKVARSILQDYFLWLEQEACGKVNYWTLPKFKGRMIDEKWHDAFSNAFTTQNFAQPQHYYMVAAMKDYLMGVDDLLHTGYAPLSKLDVLLGVPESTINSINMDTSMGPPYNKGKRNFIRLSQLDEEAFIDPAVLEQWNEVEQMIIDGKIPQWVALCALKDEATKDGKWERVFNVYSAVYNFILKGYLSPLKAFIRANPMFFECMVGIDMTSSEVNKVIDFFRTIDPDLEFLKDEDIKAMDKSWSYYHFYYIDRLWYALAFLCYGKVKALETYTATLMEKHTVLSINNDLFQTSWHTSGSEHTVEQNSLLTSIMQRYMWYVTHGLPESEEKLDLWFKNYFDNPIPVKCDKYNFRKFNALVTYGDDLALTSKVPRLENYEEVFFQELGMVVTSADKISKLSTNKKLRDIDFLKRHFVYDEDLGTFKAPLSKKSIARMLVIRKDTTLSTLDAAATSLSEALRESVYHGREFYDLVLASADKAIAELHLEHNHYLVRQTYDYWFDKLKEGKFRTWVTRGEDVNIETIHPLNIELQSSQTHNSGRISSPEMRNNFEITTLSNIDSSSESVLSNAGSVNQLPTTEFVSAPSVPNSIIMKRLGTYVNEPTNSPLTNVVQLSSVSLATSNVPGNLVAAFYPYQVLMSNNIIAEKLKTFMYIRAEIQVIGVLTVTGMASGGYAVCAFPSCEQLLMPSVADAYEYVNHAQGDNYTVLDLNQGETFAFQLPWCHQRTYSCIDPTNGPTSYNDWEVNLFCIDPMKAAITGANVSAKITFYANIKDGYELVGRVLQGKLGQKSNKALKDHAPMLHNLIGDGKGSAMAGKVADVAASLTKIPVLGAAASMVESVASGAAMVLSAFGFSRKLDLETNAVVPRFTTSIVNCDVKDLSYLAAIMSTNQLTTDVSDVEVNTMSDPLHFESLTNRLTLIHQVTISGTSPTDLFSIPVTPMYGYEPSADVWTLPPAGYCALPFKYWRADATYVIKVFKSQYQTGLLHFYWNPKPKGASVTDPLCCTSGAVMDLSVDNELELEIGYCSNYPMLATRLQTQGSALTGTDSNGVLSCMIRDPIRGPIDPTNLCLCVYVKFSNLRVGGPSQTIMKADYTYKEIATSIVYESKITLVPSTECEDLKGLYMGEDIISLRAMSQIPSKLHRLTGNVFEYPAGYAYPSVASNTYFTYARHAVMPFIGYAASERWKFIKPTNTRICATRTYESGSTVANPGPMSTPTDSGNGFMSEIQIPYYDILKFRISRFFYTFTTNPTTKIQMYVNNDAVATTACTPWFAFANDLRVGMFRQIPKIRLVTRTITAPYY